MSIKKVTFTKKAEEQLDNIHSHLTEEYSKDRADKFLVDFKDRLELVKQNPKMFKASSKSDNIRKGHFNKITSFLYRIYSKTVRVLLIKDNRMDDNTFE